MWNKHGDPPLFIARYGGSAIVIERQICWLEPAGRKPEQFSSFRLALQLARLAKTHDVCQCDECGHGQQRSEELRRYAIHRVNRGPSWPTSPAWEQSG